MEVARYLSQTGRPLLGQIARGLAPFPIPIPALQRYSTGESDVVKDEDGVRGAPLRGLAANTMCVERATQSFGAAGDELEESQGQPLERRRTAPGRTGRADGHMVRSQAGRGRGRKGGPGKDTLQPPPREASGGFAWLVNRAVSSSLRPRSPPSNAP